MYLRNTWRFLVIAGCLVYLMACAGTRDLVNQEIDNAQACTNKIMDAHFAGPTCEIANAKIDDILANDPVCRDVPHKHIDSCKLPHP